LANYVNNNNNFEQAQPTSRECPHCGAHAQLLPLATPSFEVLQKTRPRNVGLAFSCAACNEPRFVRVAVRKFEAERVELSSNLIEVERVRERFQYSYLPERIGHLFRETLECYSTDCHNAFALMCRRTVRASWDQLGRNARLRWHELYQDVVNVGEIDGATTRKLETILFGSEETLPDIGPDEAAVLIEVIKDLLYQCYVRTGKLKAAMRTRRFFAGENALANVTPIASGSRRAESA
jgi:hypothetical protein